MIVPLLSDIMVTSPVSSNLMVWVGGRYVGPEIQWESLTVEDSGGNVAGITSFRLEMDLADMPECFDQAPVRIYDPVADAELFHGHVRARSPFQVPTYDAIRVTAVDHSSLLDDTYIERDWRPVEDVTNRLAYLWAYYAGPSFASAQTYVTITSGSLPNQGFQGVTLREAIESVIRLASATADYHVDALGYLHVYEGEENGAPADVTDGGGIERLILAAHRGDINPTDGYPENTLEAMDLAIDNGADRLELDTQRSSNGTWYLMHDLTVDRTTSGTGTLTAMTDAAINALDIDGGYGYNAGRHGTTLNVPTLASVIAIVPAGMEVEFDNKEATTAGAKALAEWIVANFDPTRAIVACEGISKSAAVKRVDPRIRTMNEWAGTDDPDTDLWLMRHSDITSPSVISTKLPKRVEVYFGIEDYGLDETDSIVDAWSWGARVFITNNLAAAQTDRGGLYGDRPEIAPMDLSIDYDAGRYANRVYVQAATADASGYYSDGAAIARIGAVRTVAISAPEATTAAMSSTIATQLLRRLTRGEPRGSFSTVEGSGWRYGQRVRVSSSAHGIDAYPFRVARVSTSVLTPGAALSLRYAVEFGATAAGGQR